MQPKFNRETLPFIIKASRQRNPEWLERHREEYVHAVVEPLQAIARHLKKELSPIANGYHFPQKGLGRLKRSANSVREYGTPFKDYVSFSARRSSESRFDRNPSIFLLVYPADEEGDEVLLAGGLYLPSSRQLKAIRQAIAANSEPFDRLFRSARFSRRFPGGFSDERKSKRPPRGFDPDHPKIEWLKNQGYFVWRSYKKKEYLASTFGNLLVKDAREILRLNDLLDQAIDGRWPTQAERKRKGGRDLAEVLQNLDSVDSESTQPRKMDF